VAREGGGQREQLRQEYRRYMSGVFREINWAIAYGPAKWLHPLYWYERWRHGTAVKPVPPVRKFGPEPEASSQEVQK